MVDGSIFFKRRCALLAFDPDQSDTAALSTCAMRRDLGWVRGGPTRGSGLAGAGKLYWFESVGPLVEHTPGEVVIEDWERPPGILSMADAPVDV